MDAQAELSRAFEASPARRAEPRGLRSNAAAAPRNVCTAEDTDVLTRALDAEAPPVREHAAWALARVERR